jgi:capsid protein
MLKGFLKKLGSIWEPQYQSNRYRRPLRNLNKETRQLIPTGTHQQLVSAGRWLFGNFAPVRGALLEQCTYSVQPFIPQYVGKDLDWGVRAESWLSDWHKIMDIQGRCDFEEFLYLSLLSIKRDGDVGVMLTNTAGGYPAVQLIPAHRIASRTQNANEHNGVISNKQGRAVSYMIDGERKVSARDMALCFFPEWSDQGRGVTPLSAVTGDLQDIKELREYELNAQKAASSIALVEHNEDGYADDSEAFIDQTIDDGNLTTTLETLEGGAIRYFRAGSGSKIEVLDRNRPGANAQDFENTILRSAFQALEWPFDLSLDPSKIGGAVVRLVTAKAQRTVEKNQRLVRKIAKRIDGYALAKAMKLGLLPQPKGGDWYSWHYQGPRKISVDGGRDAAAGREDYKLGLTTLQELYADRGLHWEDEVEKRITEQRFVLDLAEKHGIDPNRVQLLTPNGLPTNENKTGV